MPHASRHSMMFLPGVAVVLGLASAGCQPVSQVNDPPPTGTPTLTSVRFWAYQIQGLEQAGAIEALAATHYDMLVLEPTRSDRDNADFDAAGMVQRLKATNGSQGQRKLVVAYVDIGEAEDWRWYWDTTTWVAPTQTTAGVPDYLIRPDPDGWAGNYPVAFWDTRWKQIMVTGDNSALKQVLDDGFDGIYMDWVEAFSDTAVIQAAQAAGLDPAAEMIRFIGEIRSYARNRNPDFVVIAQNAADLVEGHSEYLQVIDGIAQEHVYFRGDADTNWDDTNSGDIRIPTTGEGHSTQWYTQALHTYGDAGLPVFTCDYAMRASNVAEAYRRSGEEGFVPYVTRSPLSRLSTTPPPSY